MKTHLRGKPIIAGALAIALVANPCFSSFGGQAPASMGAVVNLRLADAVVLALKNHVLTRLAHERVSESMGGQMQTLSDLLPHISAAAYQERVWHENLDALGFPGGGVLGPFNDFDARFILTQKLLDLSAVSRDQAGRAGVEISRFQEEFARQKVVLIATLSYLQALRAYNSLKAAKADYGLARRLLLQAEHQHESGISTGIDVARLETRAAQEKFRLSQSRLFYQEALLGLLRVTGLSFGAKIRLMDSLEALDPSSYDPNGAVLSAKKERIEVKIAEKDLRMQELMTNEASFQYMPKVELETDYGRNGPQINEPKKPSTGQGMIKASMPIFEGGLIQGQIRQAASRREQAKLTLEDTGRQVEEDVRLALRRVVTGRDKVSAARQVVILAKKELGMARDRFSSGVGDNIEVLSAETALAGAKEDAIGALTEYHMARVNLYSALGHVDEFHLQDVSIKEKA